MATNDYVFTGALKLSRSGYREEAANIPIDVISRKGSDISHLYVSSMCWETDNRHLVLCADIDESLRCRLVRFDTATGDSRYIDDACWASAVVSRQNIVYYLKGDHRIYAANLATGHRFVVCSHDPAVTFKEPLSVNDTGSRLGVYWCTDDDNYTIGWIDTETGDIHRAAEPGFARPNHCANHTQVNPVYDNVLFFAHEGPAHVIRDRIWSVDTETGHLLNMYAQQMMPDGLLGEYVGHEIWSHDGEKLVFVKYPHSPLQPSGIYSVSRDGSSPALVCGDYPYWHVSVSPDGRWAAADTMPHQSKSRIVLIDLHGGSSRLLCEIRCGDRHPAHPHPTFSPDGNQVTFSFVNDEGDLSVGSADISGLRTG
ncbi:TolB family protein [Paenibacillus ginsengarvi]|uniref:Oligogalacturonate lyase domain-containing protein n=1 Tax=Paenibacillus ginsengarvi TaxID=400777 RepID=A0A3B0C828_9BACL|nr:hypothetical protein [Paenibacillus ginsengarvi]RKN80509.1 hypothetical protein D7M11_20430 [Paenibacillus ginsengarvi]